MLCVLLLRKPQYSFSIKGNSEDDAVLCTANKTYTIRSVVLSNSVLVATAGEKHDLPPTVVVRDQLNEVLELVPSIPRLHKLDTLLRGKEYDERSEEDDDLYADGPTGSVSLYLSHVSLMYV